MEKIIIGDKEIAFDFKLENGIVIGVFQSEYFDLSIAQKVTDYRLAFQKGKKYPLLSNIKKVSGSTKAARDFMASKEGCEGVVVAAMIIDSPIGSMIGNFFISISRPLVPTKIFTDETEAKNWLAGFVKKDEN